MLEKLLGEIGTDDPRVLLGPRVGEDAAIIDMGDRCLVVTTDPVTFATEEIGWYAVNVNANDVACCGATPRWFLATLLLPGDGTSPGLVERIFEQIRQACAALGVTLCGGHTEITVGLERPIVVGQMLGEVVRDGVVTTGGARPGDALILTKGIAVEGTAIIAAEKRIELAPAGLAIDLDACANFIHDPGISVVRDARVAIETRAVHALHDPTEGGVATGLWELAQAAGVGLAIDPVPVLPECAELCAHFGLDPLGLIASGALLIASDPARTEELLSALEAADIAAHRIGQVTEAAEGCVMRGEGGRMQPLPSFPRDEIARLFE
jgi:hydrogenase maturation factor